MSRPEQVTATGQDALNDLPVLVAPDDNSIDASVLAYIFGKTQRGWLMMFALALGGVGLLGIAVGVTVFKGVGTWGNNIPVGWAFGITNFVWWIGIGHAGTLISAILLLFLQRWRTSINRFAEAMTLFAVMCAGMYPILHLGRPWYFFYLFPYPSRLGIWPNFKSPLLWDVFAVSTYLTTSLLFWYLGLVPDLATARDRAPTKIQRALYGIFALGWRGSARHWNDYMSSYKLLAGIATPLVLSVHTIVSFDFAVSLLPGWHTTIFPPYFVAGAVFSGFAMVITLMLPARQVMGLQHIITMKHLENMNKVILCTGWIVGYSYIIELFISWYAGNPYELAMIKWRWFGNYAPVYWLTITCNVVCPNIFWWQKARRSLWTMWIVSILVNVGMWCERFMLIVTSLTRDYLPSSFKMYYPTWVDISIYVGTISFFGAAFLLFLRFVPAVATTEVKELRHELHEEEHRGLTVHGPRGPVATSGRNMRS